VTAVIVGGEAAMWRLWLYGFGNNVGLSTAISMSGR